MVGLNLTHQAQATPEVRRAPARASATRRPRRRSAGCRSSPTPTATVYGFAGPPVHDACAVALLIDPSLVRCVETFVAIETEGRWTRGATAVDLHGRLGEAPERPRRHGARRRRASGTSSSARSRRCDRRRRLDQPRPRGRRRAPPGAGRDRGRRRPPASCRAARAPTRRSPRRASGARWRWSGAWVPTRRARGCARTSRARASTSSTCARTPTRPTRHGAHRASTERGENTIVVSPGANARVDAARRRGRERGRSRARPCVLLQHEVPPRGAWRRPSPRRAGRSCSIPAPARGLAAPVDVLVPNRGELETLAGGRGDPGHARALDSTAARAVVVTLGAGGRVVVEGDRAERVRGAARRRRSTPPARATPSAARSPRRWTAARTSSRRRAGRSSPRRSASPARAPAAGCRRGRRSSGRCAKSGLGATPAPFLA